MINIPIIKFFLIFDNCLPVLLEMKAFQIKWLLKCGCKSTVVKKVSQCLENSNIHIQGVSGFMIRTSRVVRKAHFKVDYSYKHMSAKVLFPIYRVINFTITILFFFISKLSNIIKLNLLQEYSHKVSQE